MSTGRAEQRYTELEEKRADFLRRGQDCSKVTIPSLIPENKDSSADIKTPFQSVGARGVNNLSAKLLLALLPPNMPFFRLRIDNLVLEKEQDAKFKTEIEEGLSKVEQLVIGDVASSTDRIVVFEGLRHLVVGGNILFHFPYKGKPRCFHLDTYCVKRDPSGNVLEIVVKEEIAPSALPKKIRQAIKEKDDGKELKSVPIYTFIKRNGDIFDVFQECRGMVLPDSVGTYPVDACPWIPVRFGRIDGEDYGRGHVEEYLGDIISLEALSQAIIEGTAASAKVLFLVNPNGMTSVKDLAETPNCGFAGGRAEDVECLQPQKQADLRVALELADKLERRIASAFLLNQSVQRAGERVTAEEIRLMAEDLETALGGIYSLLAEEFQLPYVNCKLNKLQKQGKMDKLPKDIVKPSIVTGMEALGRASDKAKLREFFALGREAFGEQIVQYINPLDALSRLAASLGLDKRGLVKTEEDMQVEQQQGQMMQMMESLGPNSVNAVKDIMLKGGQMNGPEQ